MAPKRKPVAVTKRDSTRRTHGCSKQQLTQLAIALLVIAIAVAAAYHLQPSDPLDAWLAQATSNVLLSCAASASSEARGCWAGYHTFLAEASLPPVDAGSKAADGAEATLTLSASLTTPLTVVHALRLALGDDAYRERRAPVVIDMLGWDMPFHKLDKAQLATPLRALLPLVSELTLRGFGPEAEELRPTPLTKDGWLTLELHAGLFDPTAHQPPPTLTLLENAGLHDGYWLAPSGCTTNLGQPITAEELEERLRLAVTRAASGAFAAHTLPLACLWRRTIDALLDERRLTFVTNYHAHEQAGALDNLRSIGARVLADQPNPYRSDVRGKTHDMLRMDCAGVASTSDVDAALAPTRAPSVALFRYRVVHLRRERHVTLYRNSHLLSFHGRAEGGAAGEVASKLRERLECQACKMGYTGANSLLPVNCTERASACC